MRTARDLNGRFVYGVAGVLTLTAIYACWCNAPLIWDGAYQLNTTLIAQRPYIYLTRFHTFFLWQPVVWLSRFTANRMAICSAFGLPFLLAPAVGLLLSWWMVRRQAPWLILWVIFGVAIAPLPGQIFVINDSIFQQHLFWPLFVSLFVQLDRRKWAVLAVLSVFQFVHQIGFVLLCGATLAAGAMAVFDRDRRWALLGRAACAALLAAGAFWKLYHFVDDYAQNQLQSDEILKCWGGTRGLPIYGLACMWAAGVLFFFAVHLRANLRSPAAWRSHCDLAAWFFRLAFTCVLAGGFIWTYWAGDEHRWPWIAGYRRFVVPLSLPFYLLCWLDALMRRPHWPGEVNPAREAGTSRRTAERPLIRPLHWPVYGRYAALGLLLAMVYSTVLGIQCTLFHYMTRRLIDDMHRYGGPVVPVSALPWMYNTPMDPAGDWAITDLSLALQGKHPSQVVLDPLAMQQIHEVPPIVPNQLVYPQKIAHPPPPNTNGWYDMRPIVQQLRKQE